MEDDTRTSPIWGDIGPHRVRPYMWSMEGTDNHS